MPREGSAWDRPPEGSSGSPAAPRDPAVVSLGDPWASKSRLVVPVGVRSRPPRHRGSGRRNASLVIALAVSVFLHGLVLGSVVVASVVDALLAARRPKPVPVMEVFDLADFPALSKQVKELAQIPEIEKRNDKGQIVDIAKPASPEVAPDDARYRAEWDRRAEEETAARETALTPGVLADEFRGLDAASNPGGAAGESTTVARADARPERAREASPDAGKHVSETLEKDPFGILVPKPKRYEPEPPQDPAPAGGGSGLGTGKGDLAMAGAPNNDWLPGVRPGDRTALNAKKDFFASFWNRVQRQVEPFWVRHVRNANPGQLQRRDYLTRANVTLGPDGKLLAVEIEQSCGVPGWDRAVVAAFEEAAPFMNPPAGLIDPDGKIRMNDLGFIVSLTGGRVVHMYGDPRAGKLFPGVNEGGVGPF